MRSFIAVLIFFSTTTAFANERNVYEVRKGEVWDWQDVLGRSANYEDGAGIGVSGLIARLNGSPKLRPGTRIRLAPLTQMLSETTIFAQWPQASFLLDARTFALRWVEPACKNGFLSGELGALNRDSGRILLGLKGLVRQVPRRPRAQIQRLIALIQSPRTNRRQSQFQKAATCKNYIGILKRSGWALTELYKKLVSHQRE